MEFSNYCFDTLCVQGSPEAKVWLDRGIMFGIEGEKFQRINCATPRKILEAALKAICGEFKNN